MKRLLQWAALGLVLLSSACFAHKQSDAYLTLRIDDASIKGQWDIALRDLDIAIGLDANADDHITWGETRSRSDAIRRYAFDRLQVHAGSSDCALQPGELLIDEHVDGAYAVLRFGGRCPRTAQSIGVSYALLSGIDPNHRGLLDLQTNGFVQSSVLANTNQVIWFNVEAPDRWQQFRSFVGEGIHHIWLGYDHILFLLTLLLPAVVVRSEGTWRARSSLRESTVDILKVVTAFTLAHSLTLSLATLGVVNLPSYVVEPAIAFTVLFGAMNILFPVVRERRWLLALGFGLIHGLGFASVLADLGLTAGRLLEALIGFNAGVELGQLAIVSLLMPAAFLVRSTFFYRHVMLPVGAVSICCLAAYWMLTRAFPATVPTLFGLL